MVVSRNDKGTGMTVDSRKKTRNNFVYADETETAAEASRVASVALRIDEIE